MQTKKLRPPHTVSEQAIGKLAPRQFKLRSPISHEGMTKADLPTRLNLAERLGHTLSQVAIHPVPIQLATAQTASVHLLIQPKVVDEEQKQDGKREALMRAGIVQMKSDMEPQKLQSAALLNQSSESSGQPLPGDVQTKMERSFSSSFADVRIHEGMQAKAIGALAYTQGDQIHFAPGQYNPHTPSGQALLGHELTHVVQQRSGRVSTHTQTKGLPINADPALEQEADELGIRAARGESAPVPGSGVVPSPPQPKRAEPN